MTLSSENPPVATATTTSSSSSPIHHSDDNNNQSHISVLVNNDEQVGPQLSIANQNQNGRNQDDDDDETIIDLEADIDENDPHAAALAWIEQNGPEMEQRRRNILLRELQRVQRASFIHFLLLCLIPTALLLIVVVTVLSDEEPCGSDVTYCEQEARTFINAFTTRCLCDAVNVNREGQV